MYFIYRLVPLLLLSVLTCACGTSSSSYLLELSDDKFTFEHKDNSLVWLPLEHIDLYDVEFAVENSSNFAVAAQVRETSYTLERFRPSAFKYRVRGCQEVGICTSYSNVLLVQPELVTAFRVENNVLRWDAFPEADYYDVQRRVQGAEQFENLSSLNDTFLSLDLSIDGNYEYQVRACDIVGNCTGYSNPIMLSP